MKPTPTVEVADASISDSPQSASTVAAADTTWEANVSEDEGWAVVEKPRAPKKSKLPLKKQLLTSPSACSSSVTAVATSHSSSGVAKISTSTSTANAVVDDPMLFAPTPVPIPSSHSTASHTPDIIPPVPPLPPTNQQIVVVQAKKLGAIIGQQGSTLQSIQSLCDVQIPSRRRLQPLKSQ